MSTGGQTLLTLIFFSCHTRPLYPAMPNDIIILPTSHHKVFLVSTRSFQRSPVPYSSPNMPTSASLIAAQSRNTTEHFLSSQKILCIFGHELVTTEISLVTEFSVVTTETCYRLQKITGEKYDKTTEKPGGATGQIIVSYFWHDSFVFFRVGAKVIYRSVCVISPSYF